MRRRRLPAKVAGESDSTRRSKDGVICAGVENHSSISDRFGNESSGMADQGIGSPVSNVESLKPYVKDLGSDSDVTSEEENSSSSESEDSEDEGKKFGSKPSLCCDGAGGDPVCDLDAKAVLPSGGVVSTSMQQPSSVTSYGNINLNNSSHIHIGNKTVYGGPVTIQQYVVKDGLPGTVNQLAITDGTETGAVVHVPCSPTLKRTRVVGASVVAASKGNGLLWRHLLGRRPGPATLAAWIALGLGCAAVMGLLAALLFLFVKKDQASITPETDANAEIDEVNSGYRSPAKQQNRTILDRRRLVVVPRREWVAQPPTSRTYLKHPVEYVVISQTSTEPCTTQAECTLTVRYLQVFHVEGRKWMDIAYNFMVAGDGQAYEGRGWDVEGAHTTAGFNDISVGISFVGTFSKLMPPPVQIRACKLLIEEGVRLGKISSNYKLIADRQVSQSGNPGDKLYEEIQKWPHWINSV